MGRDEWELASFMATAIGFPFAAVGLLIVIVQTYMQKRQTRREALATLYAELDTHEARLAREYIYNAPPDDLRFKAVHSPTAAQHRHYVEDTLATLERMAYPIVKGYLPARDAFNLYGEPLLAISKKLWSYVEDQRQMRERSAVGHRLLYRRYLEEAIRLWAPEYAKTANLPVPSESLTTREMLDRIFPGRANAEQSAPADAREDVRD
jgi:hypothetical protein